MRDVIGIIVGILGFLLITVHTVRQHDTARLPQRKAAHPPLSSPSTLPPSTSGESSASTSAASSSAKESLVPTAPLLSPAPPLPTTARPTELVVAPTEPLASAPVSRPSSPPDKVIHFQSGCTGLSRTDRTALNGLLPTLRKTPDARIEIHGHTDDMGHSQFNHDLSRLRADIVHYYLQAQGIAASRFTVGGHGSSLPASGNTSATSRQRNRRTEIIIHRESLRKS
jgi:outer membrane protein OmpA-like peptidoglycan-associated protein